MQTVGLLTDSPPIIFANLQNLHDSKPRFDIPPDLYLGSTGQDQYLLKMIKASMIDPKTGKLTEIACQTPIPDLQKAQYQVIQGLLEKRFQLEKNSVAEKRGEIKLTLHTEPQKVLKAMQEIDPKLCIVEGFSFIGSGVPYCLGLEYFERWHFNMLGTQLENYFHEFKKKIETLPPDLDTRFKVEKLAKKLFFLKDEIPNVLQNAILSSHTLQDYVDYLKEQDKKKYGLTDTQTGNLLRDVLKEGYFLKYSQADDIKNTFVIATLGNSNFGLEVIAHKSLERNYLFTCNDLRLSFCDINDFSKIELKSDGSVHQSLSDLLAGIIRPHRIVTEEDWIALISLMIRGGRCYEVGTEVNLYNALCKGKEAPCQEIIDKANKRILIHHANDPEAAIAFAFQLCSSMIYLGAKEEEIKTVWKGVIENRTPLKVGLLAQIFNAIESHISIDKVFQSVEVGSLIAVRKRGAVTLSHHEVPAVQIHLNESPFCLWHRFNPEKALLEMAGIKIMDPLLQSILNTFYDISLKTPMLEEKIIPIEKVNKTKKALLAQNDPHVAELGIALHCLCQTFSKAPMPPELLRNIPFLLSQLTSIPDRKMFCAHLAILNKTFEGVFAKLTHQIEAQEIEKESFLEEWVLTLSGTEEEALHSSAIDLCSKMDEKKILLLIQKLAPYPKFTLELLRKHPSISYSKRIKTLSHICKTLSDRNLSFSIQEILCKEKGNHSMDESSLKTVSEGFLEFAERLESQEKYPFLQNLQQKALIDQSLLSKKIKEWIPSICKADEKTQDIAISLICLSLSDQEIFSQIKQLAEKHPSFATRLLSKETKLQKTSRMKLVGLILLKAHQIEKMDLLSDMLENQRDWVSIDQKELTLISPGFLRFIKELSLSNDPLKGFESVCSLSHKGLIHPTDFLKQSTIAVQYCNSHEPKSLLDVFKMIEKDSPNLTLELPLNEEIWFDVISQFYQSKEARFLSLADQLILKLRASQNPKALPLIRTYLERSLKNKNLEVEKILFDSKLPQNEKTDLRLRLIGKKISEKALDIALFMLAELDLSKLSTESLQIAVPQILQVIGKSKEFPSFWRSQQLPILEALQSSKLYQEALKLLIQASDYPTELPQNLLLEVISKGWDLDHSNESVELFRKKILLASILPESIPKCLEIGEMLIKGGQVALAKQLVEKLPETCHLGQFFITLLNKEMEAKRFDVCAKLLLKRKDNPFPSINHLVIELSKTPSNLKLAFELIQTFQITERTVFEAMLIKMNEKSDKNAIQGIFRILVDERKDPKVFKKDPERIFSELLTFVEKCCGPESSEAAEIALGDAPLEFKKNPFLRLSKSFILVREIQSKQNKEPPIELLKEYLTLTNTLLQKIKDPLKIYSQHIHLLKWIGRHFPDSELKELDGELEDILEHILGWLKRNIKDNEPVLHSSKLDSIGTLALEYIDLLLEETKRNHSSSLQCYMNAGDTLCLKGLIKHIDLESYINLFCHFLTTQPKGIEPLADLEILKKVPIEYLITDRILSIKFLQAYTTRFARIYSIIDKSTSNDCFKEAEKIFNEFISSLFELGKQNIHLKKFYEDLTIIGGWCLDCTKDKPSTNLLEFGVQILVSTLQRKKGASSSLREYTQRLLIKILAYELEAKHKEVLSWLVSENPVFDPKTKFEAQICLNPKEIVSYTAAPLAPEIKQQVVNSVLKRLLEQPLTESVLCNTNTLIGKSIQAGLIKTPQEAFEKQSNLQLKFISLIHFANDKRFDFKTKLSNFLTLDQMILFKPKPSLPPCILGNNENESALLLLTQAENYIALYNEHVESLSFDEGAIFSAQRALKTLYQGLSTGILIKHKDKINDHIERLLTMDISTLPKEALGGQLFANELVQFMTLPKDPCLSIGEIKGYIEEVKSPKVAFGYIFSGILTLIALDPLKTKESPRLLQVARELFAYGKEKSYIQDSNFNFSKKELELINSATQEEKNLD